MRRVHLRVVPLRRAGRRHRRAFGEEAEYLAVISETHLVLSPERLRLHGYCYAGPGCSAGTNKKEKEKDERNGVAHGWSNMNGFRRKSHWRMFCESYGEV